MEIVCNGQSIKEPELEQTRSFSQLMTELHRLLSLREEIITDVHADGREIASWDTVDLDVTRIARLDIATLPMRDYAISSLGDLGEYASSVLSVLRNMETICRKDGFDPVRRRLEEGLDYILTIIETSGSVLKLNLAQARYDVRSGEQMLKEMRSLRTQIAAAHDLQSARHLIEDLDFALTDWLKFLELLLTRYRDREAEVGTVDAIQVQAKARLEGLDRLQADLLSIVDDLYAGRIARSLEHFQDRISALQESLVFLQRLKEFGKIQYDQLSVNGEKLSGKISQMARILRELSETIQVGDTVLMRDLLEYEIQPFIQFLRQIYTQICSSEDS
ncbi:MAG: hypothetical protein A3G34_09220 [Candidatus Lindowbacteria bacterium RIFCSPLOWO2_12_FULL_62_27]|nr:MAG: hypothetical protein A3I06_07885 [Candidatus Lindowbacteria bacterium RIFCSPLOWO2_02_FULL_62_12]OGH60220.1 MAG: hypothetical protein A3G34_09220 [Candidatus Lindowbacteria bacterium RIFCSPLOWO2_12_FULL_62_27]